jgi:UDP-N-acetylglucosamine 4,6-dehydratase/5-epimerase
MKILITGGTGSIGQALAAKLSATHKVTIFSRNERIQVGLRALHPEYNYVVGDIRDYAAVWNAIKGQDIVYHLAALKHIDICEQQPLEAVKTNVDGTMNVLQACKYHGVGMVNMSTDKAANPLNVYGRTKRLAEDIVQDYALTIRSGNVVGSSGSLIPNAIKSIREKNMVNLTDESMTRFFITLDDISSVLMECILILTIREVRGVFVPASMKSFFIKDVLKELVQKYGNANTMINLTGIRPGEQLREYLNAPDESILLPEIHKLCKIIPGAGRRISSDDCLGRRDDLINNYI